MNLKCKTKKSKEYKKSNFQSNVSNNSGITLIALIVTIIIIIILAIVAIMAVQGDGIIYQAKNAKNEYELETNNEAITLQNYTNLITENSKEEKIPKLTIDTDGAFCIHIGDTVTIKAILENLEGNVSWECSDPDKLSLSYNEGDTIQVTGIIDGIVKVTAKCKGYSDSFIFLIGKPTTNLFYTTSERFPVGIIENGVSTVISTKDDDVNLIGFLVDIKITNKIYAEKYNLDEQWKIGSQHYQYRVYIGGVENYSEDLFITISRRRYRFSCEKWVNTVLSNSKAAAWEVELATKWKNKYEDYINSNKES